MINRVKTVIGITVACGLLAARVALAQPGPAAQASRGAWTDRVFLNINGGLQSPADVQVAGSTTFPLYEETGTITDTQTIVGKKAFLDVSAGARVFGNFGVGVGYSTVSTVGTGRLRVTAPHPIAFDSPRSASGTIDGLDHFEQAIHVMAVYVVRLPAHLELTLSAGPSFFSLQQETVTSVGLGPEVSPFMTITLATPTTVSTKGSKVGVNAGADLAFFTNARVSLIRNLGVGAFVRYAGATIDLAPEGSDPLQLKVGGLQFGGGLRVRF
jgi:hypothetical protein